MVKNEHVDKNIRTEWAHMKIPLKTPPAFNPLQLRLSWLRTVFCVFNKPQRIAWPFIQPEKILQHSATGRSTPQFSDVSPPLDSCGCVYCHVSCLLYPLSILPKGNNNDSLPNLSTKHVIFIDLSYITPHLSFFQSELYFLVSNTEANTPLLSLSDIFSIIPYRFWDVSAVCKQV